MRRLWKLRTPATQSPWASQTNVSLHIYPSVYGMSVSSSYAADLADIMHLLARPIWQMYRTCLHKITVITFGSDRLHIPRQYGNLFPIQYILHSACLSDPAARHIPLSALPSTTSFLVIENCVFRGSPAVQRTPRTFSISSLSPLPS